MEWYTHTYTEALQLLEALAFGVLVAMPRKRSRWGAMLALAFLAICSALLLTLVRASWLQWF